MQELASAYGRDVLKVRRCIHSINGKGLVRVSDGGYGFLAVKPAFFQREDIFFFMGVTASAGVYRGVVIEGKGELKIRDDVQIGS
jgi:predicted transcriptional regulator